MTIDNYFYGQDGDPLTGKVPIQVRVFGEGDLSPVRAAANNALHAFLAVVRLSPAEAHRRKFLLPGAVMHARSTYGVVAVDLYVTPSAEEEEFFGGIALKLQVYEDEETFLAGALTGGPPVQPVTPSVIQFGKAGRPAVPGTARADRTDWLIFQIARDAPLNKNPVTTGAVRIFRMKDARVGNYACEIDDRPRQYLISADGVVNESLDNFSLTKFYVCGREMLHVPSLEIPYTEGLPGPAVRIVTAARSISAFEKGDLAEAIIVVAVGLQLYAIDTTARSEGGQAEWVLLDTAPAPIAPYEANDFGVTITRERTPGTGRRTITCSGSNGAGVCSGFSFSAVKVRTTTIMDGTLSIMAVKTWEAAGAIRQRTVNVSTTSMPAGTTHREYSWNSFYETEPPNALYEAPAIYISNASFNRTDSSYYRNYDPSTEVPKDKTSGDPIPPFVRCFENGVALNYTGAFTLTNPLNEADLFPRERGASLRQIEYQVTSTASENINIEFKALAWEREGLEYSYTITRSSTYKNYGAGWYPGERSVINTPWSPTPQAIGVGEDPKKTHQFSAIDRHTRALAFRIDQGHTGVFYTDPDPWIEFSTLRMTYRLSWMPRKEDIFAYEDFPSEVANVSGDTFGPHAKNALIGYLDAPWGIDVQSQLVLGDSVWAGYYYWRETIELVGGFPELANLAGYFGIRTSLEGAFSVEGQYPLYWVDWKTEWPDYVSGTPSYGHSYINNVGTVEERYRQYPLPPPSYSFSVSYIPGPQKYDRASYTALNPLSILWVWEQYYKVGGEGYQYPWNQPDRVENHDVLFYPRRVWLDGPHPFYGAGVPNIPDATIPISFSDLIYRDLRTGGYIAQSLCTVADREPQWRGEVNPLRKRPRRLETVIGNDWGYVPLQDVLNEWRAMDELTHPDIPTVPAGEFSRVVVRTLYSPFIPRAEGESALVTPGVSLI